LIDGDLVGFHFGTLSSEERARVEDHLPGCARCVRAYLTVKSSIDGGAERERPSELLKARIRRSIASEMQKRPRRRWWVGGAAAAAAVAAITLVLVRGNVNEGNVAEPAHDSASESVKVNANPGATVKVHGVEDDSSAIVAQSLNVL
jgi:anti-sigma factor RsiW